MLKLIKKFLNQIRLKLNILIISLKTIKEKLSKKKQLKKIENRISYFLLIFTILPKVFGPEEELL